MSSDDSPRHLLDLSDDSLSAIGVRLANPLQPHGAVALSSACKGLRAPLRAALDVLKEQHEKAAELCRRIGCSCLELSGEDVGAFQFLRLTTDAMTTLAAILHWMPRLRILNLDLNRFGDAGMRALCDGLSELPSLVVLNLNDVGLKPLGAEALAAALGGGAMPKLEELILDNNLIGSHGVAALAVPLRRLPALKELHLFDAQIGDEGVASLLADLGKDDFKALEKLDVADDGRPGLTKVGCATLADAISHGHLPSLKEVVVCENPTDSGQRVVDEALAAREWRLLRVSVAQDTERQLSGVRDQLLGLPSASPRSG